MLTVGVVFALPAATVAQEPERLTLVDAARLALETHPSVAAAEARRDAAGANRDEAAAAWLPDVLLDAVEGSGRALLVVGIGGGTTHRPGSTATKLLTHGGVPVLAVPARG